MKQFKGTKERVSYVTYGRSHLITKNKGGLVVSVGEITGETLHNGELVEDTFNTIQQSDLLPSVTWERLQESIKVMEEIRAWYEENHTELLQNWTPVCFSKALSIILKNK